MIDYTVPESACPKCSTVMEGATPLSDVKRAVPGRRGDLLLLR